MDMEVIGKKRYRDEQEKLIYQKLCIPYKDEEENIISYILSQIKYEYTEAIQYYFKFGDIADDITASCLWGNIPLYDGVIASFTQKIKIIEIANWVNFGKKNRIFDFFTNIQCLLNVDNDNLRKLSVFENGEYGFIFKGKRDYFLLMNIKSLDKFDYITINNDYCQFWLIKIYDKDLLDILELKPMNEAAVNLSKKINEYKLSLKEKDSIFQKQIYEYNERTEKIVKQLNENYEKLKEDYEKISKENNELIEKIRNINKNKSIRVKKFLGLKIYEEENFEFIVDNKVIDIEEFANENDYDNNEDKSSENKHENNDDYICLICFERKRNILFEKCGHCCICEQCLQRIKHKMNKTFKKLEYFCPICNNENKKYGYSTIRKIYFS